MLHYLLSLQLDRGALYLLSFLVLLVVPIYIVMIMISFFIILFLRQVQVLHVLQTLLVYPSVPLVLMYLVYRHVLVYHGRPRKHQEQDTG